jgi:hypothetical protein
MTVGALVVISTLAVSAGSATPPDTQAATRQAVTTTDAAIRALELKRTTAMTQADVATLQTLLGDDLTYAHSSGVTDTKASMLAILKSGDLKYRFIEERDVRVRLYGDVAVLTGEATMIAKRVNAAETTHHLYFTGVWARTAGAWHFVAWHSTEKKA